MWKDGKNLCFSEVVDSCNYSWRKLGGGYTSTAQTFAYSSWNFDPMIDPKETTKQVGEDKDCEETTEVYIYFWYIYIWSISFCVYLICPFTPTSAPSILAQESFLFTGAQYNTGSNRFSTFSRHPHSRSKSKISTRQRKIRWAAIEMLIDDLKRKCRRWRIFLRGGLSLVFKRGAFFFFLQGFLFSFLIFAADAFCGRRLRTWIGVQGQDRSLCSSLVLHLFLLRLLFQTLRSWGQSPSLIRSFFWFKVHWWGNGRWRWWRGLHSGCMQG